MRINRDFRLACVVVLCAMASNRVVAQPDSLQYSVSTEAMAASEDYAPLWMISNRYDILQDRQVDGLIRASLVLPYQKKGTWFSYAAGLDAIGKADLPDSRLQQGYVKLKAGFVELKAGKEEYTLEVTKNPLGSGTLTTSGNAQPIPKITGSFPEFVAVPFTKGFVEIKGHLSHGWLGQSVSVKNSYLHEVSIYGRIGGSSRFKGYLGFIDVAQWGGTHRQEGKLPSTFSDYIKVVRGKSSSDTTLVGEAINKLGNHLGLIDIGGSVDFDGYMLKVYTQVMFEDAGGFRFFNQDRLAGFLLQSKKKSVVSGFTYEFITTKYQSGPGISDPQPWDMGNYGYPYGGRDNYYNNYLYESGWTYRGAIIGTPLFTTDARADKYFGGYQENERFEIDFAIINNRIVGHHIGIEGYITDRWKYRSLLTYTKNWGTYGGLNGGIYLWGTMDPNYNEDYVFEPALTQVYLMAEVLYAVNDRLGLSGRLGLDAGDMSNTFAASFGAKWAGIVTKQKKPGN